MPGTFLFAIIVAVIAVACAAARIPASRSHKAAAAERAESRRSHSDELVPVPGILLALTVFFSALFVVMTLVSSVNIIGSRDIGVVTDFGRLDGHVGSGLSWTPPWTYVTTIDDSYQLTDETFTVRIAGGQTAQATVQVRWNALPGAADDIFQNYKTTAGVETGLLTPELNAATNAVLDTYDPLAALSSNAPAGTADNPTTTQLGARIQSALVGRVGNDINIRTLVLKPPVYDSTVQARINSVTTQVAKTDVARQSELTAQAQAAANADLEKNLAANPLVLVQQCMTGLNDGAFTPPAGFSCWPGNGSGVVIPSGK